uniref:Uncharacterized protein n=1 Tax=Rhizophora mucronata TaxID=61149 RepID=A0A2P2J0S9_RHIMU
MGQKDISVTKSLRLCLLDVKSEMSLQNQSRILKPAIFSTREWGGKVQSCDLSFDN